MNGKSILELFVPTSLVRYTVSKTFQIAYSNLMLVPKLVVNGMLHEVNGLAAAGSPAPGRVRPPPIDSLLSKVPLLASK